MTYARAPQDDPELQRLQDRFAQLLADPRAFAAFADKRFREMDDPPCGCRRRGIHGIRWDFAKGCTLHPHPHLAGFPLGLCVVRHRATPWPNRMHRPPPSSLDNQAKEVGNVHGPVWCGIASACDRGRFVLYDAVKDELLRMVDVFSAEPVRLAASFERMVLVARAEMIAKPVRSRSPGTQVQDVSVSRSA